MNDTTIDRRRFLRRAVGLSSAALVAPVLIACSGGGDQAVCSDPRKLSAGEASLRNSLNYVEDSKVEAQACGNCAFFQAGSENLCGQCQILSGVVNEEGHCSSWSPRPA